MKRLLIALAVIATTACGKDSPTAPSTSTPPVTTPTPTVQTYTITGRVTKGVSTTAVSGATVTVVDGSQAGKSTVTDGNGRYTLDGLKFEGFSVQVTAPGYDATSRGVPLSSGVTSTTVNWQILPTARWSQTGVGNTVFDMPDYFSRVHVIATYTGFAENFIVHVGGRSFANELMGTGFNQTRYEATALTNGGGVVEIVSSSGVSWSFVEER